MAKKAAKATTKKIKARPTAKQRNLAKELIANELSDSPKPIGELLEKVGYAKNTAEAKPGEIIAQQGVQEALEEEAATMIKALKNQGVSPELAARRIYDMLHATKKVFKNNNTTGEIEEVGEQDDWFAIDKGLTHAFKLGLGGGYSSRDPGEIPISPVIFNNPVIRIEINKFEANLKQKIMEQFAPKGTQHD